ncbi:Nonspecific cytotoxic cell receptor protein-1 [Scophthalmus maximus]|uniref:Nonspecific cytotoxic cell receptor protein-1 n=1 Tax=Scophthalmus maximus TaxID=52904 RepID=A0A2U9B9J2_SCOMX|nr:Nonspecific cytotoxic cell receptor protein-1 [Scophthalmus maximus]
MSAAEFRKKFEAEWSLIGAPMPDSLDWKSVYEAKPLGRNLLRNPAPFGLSKDTPPPEPELHDVPIRGPPRFQPDGVVICELPRYSWFSMEQVVDLKAEGLWEEMLDEFQPEIVIQDWYEESQLHEFIYQLHVKLLGADKSTVISEHTVNPTEDCSIYSHTWKEVSHVFSSYGPGVRYVQFLHRLKNSFMVEFFPTLFTGSSVIVRPVKTSS